MILYGASIIFCSLIGGFVGEHVGFAIANSIGMDLFKYSFIGRLGGAMLTTSIFAKPIYDMTIESLKNSLNN